MYFETSQGDVFKLVCHIIFFGYLITDHYKLGWYPRVVFQGLWVCLFAFQVAALASILTDYETVQWLVSVTCLLNAYGACLLQLRTFKCVEGILVKPRTIQFAHILITLLFLPCFIAYLCIDAYSHREHWYTVVINF